jgi:hypothetical protein
VAATAAFDESRISTVKPFTVAAFIASLKVTVTMGWRKLCDDSVDFTLFKQIAKLTENEALISQGLQSPNMKGIHCELWSVSSLQSMLDLAYRMILKK